MFFPNWILLNRRLSIKNFHDSYATLSTKSNIYWPFSTTFCRRKPAMYPRYLGKSGSPPLHSCYACQSQWCKLLVDLVGWGGSPRGSDGIGWDWRGVSCSGGVSDSWLGSVFQREIRSDCATTTFNIYDWITCLQFRFWWCHPLHFPKCRERSCYHVWWRHIHRRRINFWCFLFLVAGARIST